MTPTEFAAYFGATAWVPHIIIWLYRWLVQPVITIVPDRVAEIGFTSYGPIFNIRLAFSADRKDAIIDGFELEVQHQDGERKQFRWSGLQETLGETRDAAGNQQQVGIKDQVPIALKIGTESLIEKYVRFQEERFGENERERMSELVAHFNHLKRTDPDYVATTLKSKQFFDLIEMREKWFWWRAGSYTVTLKLSSAKKFTLAHSRYTFKLTDLDVQRLKQNLETLRTDITNIVNSNLPDFKHVPVSWNWAYATVSRT
jgi:hypothetical protein